MEQFFQSMKRRLLIGAAVFLVSAIGSYLVVEPMVPVQGWSWLIGGFVAFLVAYVVTWFVMGLVMTHFVSKQFNEMEDTNSDTTPTGVGQFHKRNKVGSSFENNDDW